MRAASLTIASLVSIAGSAEAEPGVAAAFATLDRVDGVSRAGVDLAFARVVEVGDGDGARYGLTTTRLDAHVHYLAHAGCFGGYAAAGAAQVDLDHTTLVGAEVGALCAARVADELSLVPRIGVVLPFQPGDGLASYTGTTRVTDLARVSGDPGWARLASSVIWTRAAVVARLDLGLDLAVGDTDLAPDLLGRFGAGVGARVGGGVVAGEATIVIGRDSPHLVAAELAASYRHAFGAWSPFVAVTYTPRYRLAGFQLDDSPGAGVILGVDFTLPP